MYTIKLDIDDSIFDKVIFFLNNIPKKNMEIKKIDRIKDSKKLSLVDFFQQSPLVGELDLPRESQNYTNRVNF